MEDSVETFRSLAQLEGDMRQSEKAFVEADARFQQAQVAYEKALAAYKTAEDDRDKTLDDLNDCHREIDRKLEMLREASPIGCDWRKVADNDAAPLILNGSGIDTSDFIVKG